MTYKTVSRSGRFIATMQHCIFGLRTLVAASYIVDYPVRQCLPRVPT